MAPLNLTGQLEILKINLNRRELNDASDAISKNLGKAFEPRNLRGFKQFVRELESVGGQGNKIRNLGRAFGIIAKEASSTAGNLNESATQVLKFTRALNSIDDLSKNFVEGKLKASELRKELRDVASTVTDAARNSTEYRSVLKDLTQEFRNSFTKEIDNANKKLSQFDANLKKQRKIEANRGSTTVTRTGGVNRSSTLVDSITDRTEIASARAKQAAQQEAARQVQINKEIKAKEAFQKSFNAEVQKTIKLQERVRDVLKQQDDALDDFSRKRKPITQQERQRNATLNEFTGLDPQVAARRRLFEGSFDSNEINKLTKDTRGFVKEVNGIKSATLTIDSFGKATALAVKRYSAFLVGSFGILQVVNFFRTAQQEFLQLEQSLTKIQQVLLATDQTVRPLNDSIRTLAAELGIASKDLAEGVFSLAQAGFQDIADLQIFAENLAKIPLTATFDGIAETTDGLIATFRQFNLEATDTTAILDLVNKFAADFAVESADIFEGIRKGGAAFSVAGGDLEEFVALFSVLRERTRESAETLGTFFKSGIAQILQGSSQQLLRQLGVNATNVVDQIRELGVVLKDLPQNRQIEIARQLTGQRQFSRLLALVDQLQNPEVQARVQQALGSAAGSLDESLGPRLDDLGTSINRIRETFLKFFADLLTNPVIKRFGQDIADLTSFLLKLLDVAKPLAPILATIGAVKLGKGVQRIIASGAESLGLITPGATNRVGFGQTIGAALPETFFGRRNQASNFSRLRSRRRLLRAGGRLAPTLGLAGLFGVGAAIGGVGDAGPSGQIGFAQGTGRALESAALFGAIGSLLGPIGLGVGAGVGLLKSILETTKENKKVNERIAFNETRRTEDFGDDIQFFTRDFNRAVRIGTPQGGQSFAVTDFIDQIEKTFERPEQRTRVDQVSQNLFNEISKDVIQQFRADANVGAVENNRRIIDPNTINLEIFSRIRDLVAENLRAAGVVGPEVSDEERRSLATRARGGDITASLELSRLRTDAGEISRFTSLFIENLKTIASPEIIQNAIDTTFIDFSRALKDASVLIGETFKNLSQESNIIDRALSSIVIDPNALIKAIVPSSVEIASQFGLGELEKSIQEITNNLSQLITGTVDLGEEGFVRIRDVLQSFTDARANTLYEGFSESLSLESILQDPITFFNAIARSYTDSIENAAADALDGTFEFNDVQKRIASFLNDNFSGVFQQLLASGNLNTEEIIQRLLKDNDIEGVVREAFGDDLRSIIEENVKRNIELFNRELEIRRQLGEAQRQNIQALFDFGREITSLQNALEDRVRSADQLDTAASAIDNILREVAVLENRASQIGGGVSTSQLIQDTLDALNRRNDLTRQASNTNRLGVDASSENVFRDSNEAQQNLLDLQQQVNQRLSELQDRISLVSRAFDLIREATRKYTEDLRSAGSSVLGFTINDLQNGLDAFTKFLNAAPSLRGGILGTSAGINQAGQGVNALSRQEFNELSRILQAAGGFNLGGGLSGADILGDIQSALAVPFLAQLRTRVTGETSDQAEVAILDELNRLQDEQKRIAAEEQRLRQEQIQLVQLQKQIIESDNRLAQEQLQSLQDIGNRISTQTNDIASIGNILDSALQNGRTPIQVTFQDFEKIIETTRRRSQETDTRQVVPPDADRPQNRAPNPLNPANTPQDPFGRQPRDVQGPQPVRGPGLDPNLPLSLSLPREFNDVISDTKAIRGILESLNSNGLEATSNLVIAPLNVNVTLTAPDILRTVGPQIKQEIMDEISIKLAEIFEDEPERSGRIARLG